MKSGQDPKRRGNSAVREERVRKRGTGGDGQLACVDLFCGAGGLSQGFRQAGYRILGGADTDPDACATYARNFPSAEAIYGDLRTPRIRDRIKELAADADVIIGGPPCQAFSQMRNHDRMLADPRNALYREFVRVVESARPLAFVMENVPGMSQLGIEEKIARHLSLDGEYRVRAQVVDACDFGVPQTRKRLVFLALHRSIAPDAPCLAGTGASDALALVRRVTARGVRYAVAADNQAEQWKALLGLLQDPANGLLVAAEQAIGDLRFLRASRREDELAADDLPAAQSAYQRAMRNERGMITNVSVPRINEDTNLRLGALPAGGNYRDLPEEMQSRYLTGQKWGPHNGSGQLGRRHYYAYRRLHPDIWAWTLNTKADSVYHWSERRALSVREFARLQSFPDSFVFTTDPRRGELPGRIEGGAAHSRYRQAGNAVPPLLAQAIATTLSEAIASALPGAKKTA